MLVLHKLRTNRRQTTLVSLVEQTEEMRSEEITPNKRFSALEKGNLRGNEFEYSVAEEFQTLIVHSLGLFTASTAES